MSTFIDHKQLGHLYIIDGDLQRVAVDAWLLPTDGNFALTQTWQETISKVDRARLIEVIQTGWQGEPAAFLANVDGADVWLGDVGRTFSPLDHYVDCARAFLQRASESVRNRAAVQGRLPVLAINHLGTGSGGVHHYHGHVLHALIKAITDDLNNGSLLADVVLVSWGERPESAAQFFRHQKIGDWASSPQWDFGVQTSVLHDLAVELAAHLRRNSLSTFLGAGTSVGAGLPGWKDLLTEIAQRSGLIAEGEALHDLGDLRDQAALINARLRKRDNLSLHSLLTEGLAGSKYSLQHGLLASLPCNEYITTNVDELFEDACRTNNRTVTVMPDNSVTSDRWLLKLHGTISQPEKMIFTRENYLDAGRSSRALMGLVQAMLFTRHMLFVGYGLADEDFHELVYEVRKAFGDTPINWPIGTVLLLKPEPLKAEIWEDILRIVPVGTSDDLPTCARDLARFLDLVGMLSADKYRFFLDPNYNHEGFEAERDLQEQLLALAECVSGSNSAAAIEIRQTLARLGLD